MTRGRKPQPTVLKLVKGGGRVNKSEAKVPLFKADPPVWLNPEAREEWERVSAQLYRSGLMTGLDRAALAAYCTAYARFVKAETALDRAGEGDPKFHAYMVRTSKGTAIQNPLVGVANQAREALLRAAGEFGMTPSARSRVTAVAPHGEDNDPAAEFFD